MVYLYSVLCCLFLFPYLGWQGGKVLGSRGRKFLWGGLSFIFVFYAVAFLTHRHIQADWMSHIMNGSIYIFFSTMYATGIVLLLQGLCLLDKRTGLRWYADASPMKRRRLQLASIALTLLVFFGTMLIGHWSVRYPQVIHQDLYLHRLTKAGEKPQKRLRLVFFSDLHIGEAMTPDYIQRAVDLIQAQHPDLILCGGDYIDHRYVYAYEPRVIKIMQRLKAPLGVYFVPGNHEYRDDLDKSLAYPAQIGATLLRDSIVYPGDSLLALIGRDDWVNGDRKPFTEITSEVQAGGRPAILFEHTPISIDSLASSSVDLMLCGHTHGGQLWPGMLLTWWKYGLSSGTRMYGDKEVCVSAGIGSAGATYRFGTRSEIRVFDLYW